MAEKAYLFQDSRVEVLIMSSPDPSTHKRIGRGVYHFDNTVWDRVRKDAVIFCQVLTRPDYETTRSEN